MFGSRFTLFRVRGIDIGLDLSWAILFLLITWSLARGLFPFRYEDLPRQIYWWMGIAGAIGLFVSILLHELSHALVAQRFGIPIRSITLFVFGGVAEMTDEPPRPAAEFLMAAVGPLTSLLLGLVLFGFAALSRSVDWPIPVRGVLGYLSWINFIVAGFNLLPAFPLDGGRILRAVLWRYRKDLRWATRISSLLGSGFGILLSVVGVVWVLYGDFIGGIWYFIIGMFLRNASQAAYQQVVIREAFAGVSVRQFMRPDPVTIPPSLTLQQALEEYFYRYDYKLFPVVEDGRLLGCITPKALRDVPREQWTSRLVGEIAARCTAETTISPTADVTQALSRMNRAQISRLMVVQENELLGILTLKDLLHFLSIRMDLEGNHSGPFGEQVRDSL